MRIFYAILSLAIGIALLLSGYRLARYLIPLMGFLAGLSLGGAVISDLQSTPFLGTALGIFIGVIMGLLLAALSYFYYVLAVLVMIGGLGYWAGSGFVLLFGFHPGVLSTLVGIGAGIALAVLGLIINLPRYFLILITSIAGSAMTVGGVLLLFKQIPLDTYSYATARVAISHSVVWSIIAFALLAFGLVSQIITTADYDFERWTIGRHGGHLPPTTPSATGVH